ncbi:MAG: transporter substrate-binding domain-containing protein [Spirochaetes bacterium]|nr:transporter substrate-binding domain-containing protein [Spirochaetota bacterium]
MKRKLLVVAGLALCGLSLVFAAGQKEAAGYSVAVVTGTTFEAKALEFENVSSVKLYEDDNQTLSELANGRVDAVITDRIVGINAISNERFNNLTIVGDLIYQEIIGVAIHKDNAALRQALNRSLAEIIQNGSYAEISTKWFGADILAGLDRPTTVPGEAAATDNSLTEAKNRGYVTFAMSGGYPPFNFYNDQNVLTGFDVEIARAVVENMGLEYRPVTTAWDGIIEGLRAKRYDGVWGSMAITDERLRIVDFTDPYYISGAQLVVQKGSPILGPETLAGNN